MIDQLIKLVEQNAGEAIIKNKAIPNQFNNAAIQDVAEQIFSGLKGQVSQGNMQQVASMFNGGNVSSLANNPMVTQIISNIAADFGSKFGVSPQVAQSIASGLIPQVLNQFINKTNDPNDRDFDLQDMMRGFSGNSNLNINDILGQVTGNKSNQGLGGVGDVLGKLFGGK
jgi:CxxC motif-containing protein (DUF1111 family)